ncbi:hypothetical protein BD311DRAFT_747369 [Dichomitus squalens]|uniref:DUF7918 domain-containing protein n=1 Tax=Dichomitus squalens TaxID=114155 RepID=A0A4Q9N2R9_9APHY|nr:hypothetical protein BD311DRAFT_747369 [Dichomitus squalens]
MHLNGYTVWISCDGKSLPEYKTERKGEDRNTITCYIPSETGETFSIEWRDYVNQSHLRFVTKVDGRAVGGNRCRPGGKGLRWGVRTSTTTRQPFQFAPLRTTDDEEHMYALASHAALGEIEVSVIRIRAEYRSVPHTMGKFRPVEAVHERSKKAGVHCVSLGANRQVPLSRTQTSSTPLNPREGPVAKFVFRYRPKALLQAQGIIPIPLPAADRKPALPDRKLKRRPSSDGEGYGDAQPAHRAKRARHIHNIDEEDVKPRIFKIDLSDEEDVKPDIVKDELSDNDEEEEEVAEAVIGKDEPSEDEKEEDEEEEDLEVLQSQIQQLQEKLARAARRKSLSASQSGSQSHARNIKKEEPGPATQLGAVVIDLTLEDDD